MVLIIWYTAFDDFLILSQVHCDLYLMHIQFSSALTIQFIIPLYCHKPYWIAIISPLWYYQSPVLWIITGYKEGAFSDTWCSTTCPSGHWPPEDLHDNWPLRRPTQGQLHLLFQPFLHKRQLDNRPKGTNANVHIARLACDVNLAPMKMSVLALHVFSLLTSALVVQPVFRCALRQEPSLT